MLKVCFIISGLAYSGAEVVLDRYIDNNKYIDPYFIIIYDYEKIYANYINKYGEDKVFTLKLKHNKYSLRFVPLKDIIKVKNQIALIIDDINPDILYSNNTIETMLMYKFIKNLTIPTIAHIHDMKNSIKSPIRKLFTLRALNYYDEIITVSNATKKQWNIEKMKVVYNGIPNDYFVEDFNRYKINCIKNIGYIGSISKRKGFDLIIKSIDELLTLDINLYIVYSNIEDLKLFEKLKNIETNNADKIKVYESLNSEQIISLYDELDLLMVPSREDPLPTVIIEAMARGVIVTGNNIGGIPEMISERNNLIDEISSESLVKKINYFKKLKCAELRIIQQSQLKYCKQKFNNEVKKEKINKILSEGLNDE